MGTNVPAQKFVEAVREHGAQLVGLSALLTTTMPAMRQTVSLLKEQGITTKIMIGGPPVTQEFANEISADGYSPDAASAVDLARSLLAA